VAKRLLATIPSVLWALCTDRLQPIVAYSTELHRMWLLESKWLYNIIRHEEIAKLYLRVNLYQGTSKPMFRGSNNQMRILVMLYGQTGSGKLNMAASKLRIRIISACTLVSNKIPTAVPMLSGSNYQIRILVMFYGKPEVENSRDGL